MSVFGREQEVHEPTHADEQAMAVVAVVMDEAVTAIKRYVKRKDNHDAALHHLRTATALAHNSIKEVGIF